MSQVDTRYEAFWQKCRHALGPAALPDGDYRVRAIGKQREICELILKLIEAGDKTGTFSLTSDFEGTLPRPGEYQILTDFEGEPRCVVRIDATEVLPFRDIGSEHTQTEGPELREVGAWKTLHRGYWTPLLQAQGQAFSEELPVVFQRFTRVYP